jgi:hypothetical protein
MKGDGDFSDYDDYDQARARPSAAGALVILGALLVLAALVVTMLIRKLNTAS